MICFCERKLKKVLFSLLIYAAFLVIVTSNFHIWNLFPFFGRIVQKVILSCFSDSFIEKTTQQKIASVEGSLRTGGKMAAVMLQVIPSFYTNYSKNSLFISANTYEKFVLSKEYCIARHDDKMCFLTNCRYHIIILGNIKVLLQNLDAFCFNYQHVDCLYTLLKYRFSGKNVVKSG